MIYLDNGATTFPKPKSVMNAVDLAISKYGANPGRSGHDMSMRSSTEIYNCRENIRALFNAESAENIIFTLNCTMALNIVIKGLLKEGDHVVVSSLEHNSVMRPLEKMKENGITYSVANVIENDNDATVDSFRNAMNPSTRLVVCTHASNVFGIKLPISRIAALCRFYNIPICVDAAQTAGVVPIDIKDWGVDYLCTAGHKGLYGPMGTGVLVINTEHLPNSLIEGGTGSSSFMLEQPVMLPDKFESGTPNLIGIAGLNAGVSFVRKKTELIIFKHEMMLVQTAYDALTRIKGVKLFTSRPSEKYHAPVLSFAVNGKNSEDIAMFLNEKYKIAVRAGLHCAPAAHEYMNTIEEGTVRICPSAFTNISQINILIRAIKEVSAK